MDYDEIDILTDIYADVLNYIEHIQTSRKRIMNIKNRIQVFDNNYFEIYLLSFFNHTK